MVWGCGVELICKRIVDIFLEEMDLVTSKSNFEEKIRKV